MLQEFESRESANKELVSKVVELLEQNNCTKFFIKKDVEVNCDQNTYTHVLHAQVYGKDETIVYWFKNYKNENQ
jgi:hypothetical protein